MKITKLKTYICNAFRTNFVFVKVETDSGLHGWGEATLEYRELTVQAAIRDLESYLIGKDPHNIEAFRHDCYRDAYWRGGPVLMSALAGVEMADSSRSAGTSGIPPGPTPASARFPTAPVRPLPSTGNPGANSTLRPSKRWNASSPGRRNSPIRRTTV